MCRKTTRFFSANEQISKIFPACQRRPTPDKSAFIRIFDVNNYIGGTMTEVNSEDIIQELQAFFNGLSNFDFQVSLEGRNSTPEERKNFGVMDFPNYLVSTDAPNAFTSQGAKEMLDAHSIPTTTYLMRFIMVNGQEKQDAETSFPYFEMDNLIPDDSILGVGVPGSYFDGGTHSMCRKIGFIKVNRIKKDPKFFSIVKRMFIAVLKHEIGHMFGLRHENNTIMHGDYQVQPFLQNPTYTPLQLKIINDVLTKFGNN